MSEKKNSAPVRPVPAGGGPRGPRAMGPMQPIHKETVARLLKYIVPFWPRLVFVLVCIVLNAIATAAAATFLGGSSTIILRPCCWRRTRISAGC